MSDSDGHADYPHEPGTLYDCLKCETECYCNEDGECLMCANANEGDK